jgi:proton glutamate symport protein
MADRTIVTPPAGRFFTLTRMIVAGLVVGCLLGWLAPGFAISLKPISDVFLRLIKMILAPLLFTTLVAGIAGAGIKTVGRLGLKAIVWFEAATTAALFVGLAAANLIKPGAGAVLVAARAQDAAAAKQLAPAASAGDFFVKMVPTSILDAMSRNDVLQIVVFSVFLGLAVSAAGPKAQRIKELADAGAEAVFKLVGFVMYFAPFGVCAAIAVTLGSNGASVLLPLVKCVLALYAALAVFFVVLFAAVRLLVGIHLPTFLRVIREPAIIAFTTASSDAALPRAMQLLEQLGVPRRIVGFVVPAGYAFNLDGSTLYLSLAVMFVAQAAGVEMSWGAQLGAMLLLMAASKGVAGVPRAALVVLANTLGGLNLPQEGVVLLLGIDAVMDMGRTSVNVVGNCVAAVVMAKWENALPADAPIFGRTPLDDGSRLPAAQVVSDVNAAGPGYDQPTQ